MKLDHLAGEEMFIDYAGKKLHITDKETGELNPVEVFVSILPCSQYTYVTACMSQKQKDLISSCVGAIHFFGGVSKRSEEQTSELQSRENLVCRLLLEKKKK